MKRYLKIFLILLKLNTRRLAIYKANLISNIVSSTSWGILSVVIAILLTTKSPVVFGWTRTNFIILTAILNVVLGFYRIIFDPTMWTFTRKIHYGELDLILLRPLDSQFQMNIWDFDLGGTIRVSLAIVFAVYLFIANHINVTIFQFAAFILLAISGITIFYAVNFIVLTITIWNTNLSNLVDLVDQVSTLSRYPKEMYQQLGNIFYYILFPIVIIISVPTQILLGQNALTDSVLLVIFSILFFAASRFFWKFALRFYTSASG